MNDLDRRIQLASHLGILAYQLRELLAIIESSDSLDEIRAQAALARRPLEQAESSFRPCE